MATRDEEIAADFVFTAHGPKKQSQPWVPSTPMEKAIDEGYDPTEHDEYGDDYEE